MRPPHPAIAAAARFLVGTFGLLLVASVLIFTLVRSAPGDPIEIEFGSTGADAYLTPEQQAQARELRRDELGLDGPVVFQYLRWLERVVQLDLGISYRTGQPVTEEILSRLPASIALGAAGFAVAMLLAIAMGLLGARRPGDASDHAIRLGTLAMATVPTFLSGTILLRWAAGQFDYPLAGAATVAKVWLPALVIGLSSMATMSRLLRASLIAERSRPYAAAAAARGAGPSTVLLRHVGRPALTPVLTLAGLAFAGLIAGSVITETVFSWPGVSAYAVGAIADQDYAVVQAYVLLVVAVVVIVNRAVDAVQNVLDPRVAQRAEVPA
ncbi:ABC transporter permease [Gordonia sp. NPDC058843]|uniref:ABC transporter permease n=1 Tax=Gordonia sp. NPDC058843 TaxID=3346648 RepID=UPI0036AB7A82